MKFTKMSLVAALLIGSSAFAIDNVKVSGDAKLYYSTDDAKSDGIGSIGTVSDSLFNAGSSAGQAALGLGITADLTKNVSAGVHATILSTLGLEGQLVNNVWEGTDGTTDSWIIDEAWIAGTVGKTTGKIGRMELDTPLVFTEKWSIAKNTFEAAVVINQDVPDTTIVAAYVGGSNSNSVVNNAYGHGISAPAAGIANVVQSQNASNTTFQQFYNGAFAAGVINNSFKPLTVQAWYYDAPQFLDAYWLQADLDAADLGAKGLTVGAQYSRTNYNASNDFAITTDSDNDVYAFKLGYEMKDLVAVSAAYSATGKDDVHGFGAGANIATYNGSANSKSKLYTEAWWNYGYVTRNDTNAWNITVTSPVQGMFDLAAYYTSTSTTRTGNTDIDMTEFTLTAGKDFGPLNATIAYIYTNADDQNDNTTDGVDNGEDFNTIQVYLTYNF